MDSATRTKINQHLVAVQSLIYRTINGGFLEVMPHWARGYSGLKLPIFNTFLPLHPDALSEDMLADTAAFYSSRNVLYSIELIHDLLPHGPDFLDQRQYQSLPPQIAMALEGLPKTDGLNNQVHIERVETVPSLTAFCALLHSVFDFPLREMVKLYPVSHLKNEQIGLYLAFADEKPVGAGTLLCADGVATLTHMVTIDDYRNRGVATTLTYHMLADAREENCHLATMYATAQAYKLFSGMGFEMYSQRQLFLPPDISYAD